MVDGVGTSGAVVMCKVPISEHDENGVLVSISVIEDWIELNDIYRIYVGCDDWDDPNSGVCVEFQVTSLDPLKITTTIPGGGTDGVALQAPDPYGTGTAFRMEVCADHLTGQIKAGVVSAADPQAWALVDPGPGRYVGVGHNNTAHQNHFDDFNMEELRMATQVCADCWCWCLRRVPFRHLTATITNATGRVACLSGYTWSMDWEYDASLEQWVGTVDLPQHDSSTVTVTWRLKCDAYDDDNPDHPGHNWLLSSENSSCQFSNSTVRANDTSECDPEMALVFGPYSVGSYELNCLLCLEPGSGDGSFTVEITE